MNGSTHRLVANLALSCLDMEERHILYPRWGGIESGVTVSDDFRIMWEPDVAGSKDKQLVHRYFVDSDDSKDHGCVIRAWDHATGSVGFMSLARVGPVSSNLGLGLSRSYEMMFSVFQPLEVWAQFFQGLETDPEQPVYPVKKTAVA